MKQQQSKDKKGKSSISSKTHGPQGVDKAPGEETSEDNVQFKQETQKGKKVDADPEEKSGKPAKQSL